MRDGKEQSSGGAREVGREGEVVGQGSGGAGEREERRTAAKENHLTRPWIEVPLTGGHYAIIDAADEPLVRGVAWRAREKSNGRVYAYASVVINNRKTTEQMHRRIMQPPPGFVVDHVNHNTLDNRRLNLRICTNRQNSVHHAKTLVSKVRPFRGVYKSGSGWAAAIKLNDRSQHLGTFPTPELAAKAYDDAASAAHGPFATLNFPGTR